MKIHRESGFPIASARALQDTQMRRNLRNATDTIRAKRAQVVAELPEWEQLRETAAAIRDETLANLDIYLEQFEHNVTMAGGHVHWARDGEEACRIVTELIQATGATEAIKMKSMVSEEIELDAALKRSGIDAWETDLAELIIQEAGDSPSHIVVPAIHWARGEVRALFAKNFDRPDLSDDPTELAEVARQVLRERFMRAQVGITSANFAVAETGTISLTENEGNGRMCTTLPGTLISLVAIDKLVPRVNDLGVLTRLLPRSAVGARKETYQTIFTGVTPGDGPQDFHVVMIDNGRTNVLRDPVGREALRCIRCAACLNICPVYERAGGHAYEAIYPGPIGAILSPQLTNLKEHQSLPWASSLCGACAEVCPVKIDIPGLLIHLRERVAHETKAEPATERLAMRMVTEVFSTQGRYEAAQRALALGKGPLRHRRVVQSIPGPLAIWGVSRDVPEIPAQSFRAWWKARAIDTPSNAPEPSNTPAPREPEGALE